MVCFPGALDTRPHLSLIIRTLACVLPFLNFEHYKDKKHFWQKQDKRFYLFRKNVTSDRYIKWYPVVKNQQNTVFSETLEIKTVTRRRSFAVISPPFPENHPCFKLSRWETLSLSYLPVVWPQSSRLTPSEEVMMKALKRNAVLESFMTKERRNIRDFGSLQLILNYWWPRLKCISQYPFSIPTFPMPRSPDTMCLLTQSIKWCLLHQCNTPFRLRLSTLLLPQHLTRVDLPEVLRLLLRMPPKFLTQLYWEKVNPRLLLRNNLTRSVMRQLSIIWIKFSFITYMLNRASIF